MVVYLVVYLVWDGLLPIGLRWCRFCRVACLGALCVGMVLSVDGWLFVC